MIRFPTVTQPEAIKFLQRARMHAVSLTLITNGTRQLLCANGCRAPSYSGASVDCSTNYPTAMESKVAAED